MAEGSRETVEADDDVVSAAESRDLRKQIREVQRVLGKKTMEVEILREAMNRMNDDNRYRAYQRGIWKICREDCRRNVRGKPLESNRAIYFLPLSPKPRIQPTIQNFSRSFLTQ